MFIFSENAHFGQVGFAYGGAEKSVDTLPPFRRGAFWSPKCIPGPKNAFWAPKRTFGPKIALLDSFCALAQKAYETKGFWLLFWRFGSQKAKMSQF